jgi:hypothetical protein
VGFGSQAGYFGLRQYAGGGTVPADLATAGVVYRLRSGSLGPNRDLLVPDAEIGGNRDISDAYLGAVSWSGDLDMYLRLKEAGSLLAGVLGTATGPTGTLSTGGFVHTINPTESSTLPFFWAEEQISGSPAFEVFSYQNLVMNTLHLEAEANGYLMATVGALARVQTAGVTPTAGLAANRVDQSPMIVGTNITVTYNAVTMPAKSFSLDVNNNVEDDDYRLGSFFLGEQTAKRREVTAGLTVRPTSSALWRQAVYGVGAATGAGGITTKQPVVITINSYEDMPGVTGPANKYTLTITIPNAILTPLGLDPSGDDVIEHDLEIQAVRPAVGTSLITATLRTDKATIA